jgi:large subunit ribosomal protein L32
MALQKRRLGRSRVRNRRSAWSNSFNKPLVSACPNCSAPKLGHRVCMKCGVYDGESVIEVATDDEE